MLNFFNARTRKPSDSEHTRRIFHSIDVDFTHPICIVTDRRDKFVDMIRWLSADKADAIVVGVENVDILKSLDFSYVFLDLDTISLFDQQNIISLFELRERNPSKIVICLSSEFHRDDFGQTRLAICDSSLKIPFSLQRLEMALTSAEHNNKYWCERCEQFAR